MRRTKPSVKYHGISLPVPLIEEIKKFIQDKPQFRSVADFVKEAIRKEMDSKSISSSDLKKISDKIQIMSGEVHMMSGYFVADQKPVVIIPKKSQNNKEKQK